MARKEVYFNQYCPTCMHRDVSETEDPCNDCLAHGNNEDSHKPIRYKEKDDTQKKS